MNDNMREYLVSLLEKGVRVDTRKLDEYRKPIVIETGISKNAEGSSRVKIGDSEVVAGVKLDVGEPYSDGPDKGVLVVGAELLALSSPNFQLGPPDAQTTELARVVDRGIRNSKMIDTKKLCVREGELVWMVFLDIYTINDAGNLIDASALAAIAALKNSFLPVLKDDKVQYGEHTKVKLPILHLPITCTLGKAKEFILVDPCLEEENLLDSRLTITISEHNDIHAMQKGGMGSLRKEDIDKMIKLASERSKELRGLLK